MSPYRTSLYADRFRGLSILFVFYEALTGLATIMPPIRAQYSARSARMMNDEGRLALVETICAQRSELFIRTSSFVNRTSLQLPIYRPINLSLPEQSFAAQIEKLRQQSGIVAGVIDALCFCFQSAYSPGINDDLFESAFGKRGKPGSVSGSEESQRTIGENTVIPA